MSRKSIKFSFLNSRRQNLAGILDLPEGEPLFYGVFAPCFTCTKESHAAHKVSRALAERGIGVLRFDMTGLGESEGDFAETNFSTRILDLVSACHAVAASYAAPKILIGHSISGTAALPAAKHVPSLQAVATLGSPRDPKYIIDKFKKNNQMAVNGDMIELTIANYKVNVQKSFVDDMLSHDVVRETASYDRKLFIFHAPHDEIANYENAEIIYDRATCDKELIRLSDSATHLLERGTEDSTFIADTIRAWFDVHLK